MRVAILINGAINSGKSTVGALVAQQLPNATFMDGDDHDAPDHATLEARIAAAWRRIEERTATETCDHLVIAYPIDDVQYSRLSAVCATSGARLLVITLAPPIAIALSDRGDRRLSAEERTRIAEMYQEGYASRAFSELTIDNSKMTPHQTASAIVAHVEQALSLEAKN